MPLLAIDAADPYAEEQLLESVDLVGCCIGRAPNEVFDVVRSTELETCVGKKSDRSIVIERRSNCKREKRQVKIKNKMRKNL